ncbi:MAG TPA: ABC transporter ATP-binding protein [Candidatus Nanopelagicales bacterium]|nr:ABC transporter ATP-binding protein [Candidatus Nanopelagicales bacterium]
MNAEAHSIATSAEGAARESAGLEGRARAGRVLRDLRRAAGYFREDAGQALALLGVVGGSIGVGLLQAWPVAVLVDLVATGARAGDWVHRLFLAPLPESLVGRVVGLAVIGLGLRLVQEVLGVCRTWLGLHLGYAGLTRLRHDLYRRLQALHLGYHHAQPEGDALYRLNQDATSIQGLLQLAISVTGSGISLVVMIWIMSSRSGPLTLLALSVAPPLLWANVRYGRLLRSKCSEAKEVERELTTVVQRGMGAIGLIQAFGREAEEAERYQESLRSSVRAWLRLHRDEVRYALVVGATFGIGGALVLGYGGTLVVQGRAAGGGGMSIGDLTVFLVYLGMLYDPLCKLTGAGASAQAALAGFERVLEVLDRDPLVRDAPGATALARQPRTLTLDGVGFSYRPGRPVLSGVSAIIRPGEMVAFVGSSGVGKSTLLNLIPRFHDPDRGAIRLDGLDVRGVRVADLRRHVALALQDSVILPTTIAENIAYGRPGASRAEIRRVAAMAGAEGFIEALPEGYDTRLDEQGQGLSGGQRQRIANARALLTEAPILVLDEPTSALDPEHERLVTEALRGLRGQRTIVLVSHRIGVVSGCDRIYVLGGGRVAEQGTPGELLARSGVYARMARAELSAP